MTKSARRRLSLAIAFFLCLVIVTAAAANDAAIEAYGGTIRPMKQHRSIRMLAERVEVDLSPDRVEVNCLFIFKNLGPATTVQMGFPEFGYNTGNPIGFTRFATWVDGRLVPARRVGSMKMYNDGDVRRWRVKTVSFRAKQTRVVRVRYTAMLGEVSDGTRFFQYDLDTGASWKGTIGKAEVTVRLHRFEDYWPVRVADPAAHYRRGNRMIWRWRNLEPSRAKNGFVFIEFLPGYNNIVADGERVSNYMLGTPDTFLNGRPGVSMSTYSYLIGKEAWISAASFALMAHGEVGWEARSRRATLYLGTQALQLRPGSRRVLLAGKPLRLKHPPRIIHGRLFVPARELVVLLGGKAWFDKKTKTTHLILPGAAPES